MSGIASGIGKVFATVGSGVARVTQGVMGVGGALFSGGAATGSASAAAQAAGGSTLRNVLTGAIKQAGVGALLGGAVGAVTGQGFGKGALIGGLGGAVTGGLMSAAGAAPAAANATPGAAVTRSGLAPATTPTGAAPTGVTTASAGAGTGGGGSTFSAGAAAATVPAASVPAQEINIFGEASTTAAAPAKTGMGGFGQFLTSEKGGSLIAGIGKGLSSYMESKQKAEEAEKDRQFQRDREERIRGSYSVDPNSLPGLGGASDTTQRPTPAVKYGRKRYEFDPSVGRIVAVAG